MFPIKIIETIYQEINHYYLQVIAFQDKDSQYYQDIITRFSKTILELEDIIQDIRMYNNK